MYGVNYPSIKRKLYAKILQTIQNLVARYGELGRCTQLTKDLNLLMP